MEIFKAEFYPNLAKKYRKYDWNFIYARSSSMALNVPTLMETILTNDNHMKIIYTKFAPNRPNNLKINSKNSLIPLTKVWLSLQLFSQNLCLLNSFCKQLLYSVLWKSNT
jgi:hypothetical protein